MKLVRLPIDQLRTVAELQRSASAKAFEERLRSSIQQIGLAEPLKVARHSDGHFVVIDGNLRLEALRALRDSGSHVSDTVPAFLLSYEQRFEIRFQSDIYQDLLPSQLAALVEHLHRAEHVRKNDIARYIGVSPPTLRNYTGLWRLMERGGLFARIVELMDTGVFPASNPYAWLRLTSLGLHRALLQFSGGMDPGAWADEKVAASRRGIVQKYQLKFVETVTSSLPAGSYRVGEDVRAVKRDLGLRRARNSASASRINQAREHLTRVSLETTEPVLRFTAKSLQDYLS